MKKNAWAVMRPIAIALAATTALSAPIAAQRATPPAAPVDPKLAEQVHQILMQHPEYIFEAASAGQQRQRDAQLAQQSAKVDNVRATLTARAPFGPGHRQSQRQDDRRRAARLRLPLLQARAHPRRRHRRQGQGRPLRDRDAPGARPRVRDARTLRTRGAAPGQVPPGRTTRSTRSSATTTRRTRPTTTCGRSPRRPASTSTAPSAT